MHFFPLLTNTKQLLLMTCCDTTAIFRASFPPHAQTNGTRDGETNRQTDVEVEIVI